MKQILNFANQSIIITCLCLWLLELRDATLLDVVCVIRQLLFGTHFLGHYLKVHH